MKARPLYLVLATALALGGTGLTQAGGKPGSAAGAPSARASDAAAAPAASTKLVDINSATAAELKTLPGIGEAEAAKIIAGRPYGSKAHLVTRNVLSDSQYESLKRQVVAKQPYKDGKKNAALQAPKK